MKKLLMLAGALCAILILPGLASATHFDAFDVTADCDGWAYNAEVYFRSTVYEVDVDYLVVLTDDMGAEVARFEGTTGVTRQEDRTVFLNNMDVWGVELCGTYNVFASIYLYSSYGEGLFDEDTMTFEDTFTCECDTPDDACHLTPGYWKNHASKWPVDHLMLGGVDMSQDELLMILKSSVRGGDATVILAHHTIAAKLNLLTGTDDSINSVIDEADAWLMMYPVFSNPDDKEEGLRIKDLLCDYNEMECDEDEDEDDDEDEMDKAFGANEETTFDSMKALYK